MLRSISRLTTSASYSSSTRSFSAVVCSSSKARLPSHSAALASSQFKTASARPRVAMILNRRSKATSSSSSSPEQADTSRTATHSHDHDHSHDKHSHSHSHSHGLFHSHAGHSHGSPEEAESLVAALTGKKRDRGSRITLIGLASNVGLTGMKAAAGIWMNSASLLAEAGHSLSDMLGDFVTLACWRISRRPPTADYPWGYTKYETIGTLTVSLILVGGAIGIGLHSYHLLLQVILPWLEALDPSHPLAGIARFLPSSVPSPLLEMFHAHGVGEHVHDHAHGHAHDLAAAAAAAAGTDASSSATTATTLLNPHAAWFALISVIVKEWLYRATTQVAKEEHSPVLHANALHHRSDALTSAVALGSILGSAAGAPILDPLGGLLVSFFILQQGASLSRTAFLELLDKGVDAGTRRSVERIVGELVDDVKLLGVRNVRGVKSGGLSHMDLTLIVPPTMTVRDSHSIELAVRERVMSARREVRELKVHMHALEEGEELGQVGEEEHDRGHREFEGAAASASATSGDRGQRKAGVGSDFGRDGC